MAGLQDIINRIASSGRSAMLSSEPSGGGNSPFSIADALSSFFGKVQEAQEPVQEEEQGAFPQIGQTETGFQGYTDEEESRSNSYSTDKNKKKAKNYLETEPEEELDINKLMSRTKQSAADSINPLLDQLSGQRPLMIEADEIAPWVSEPKAYDQYDADPMNLETYNGYNPAKVSSPFEIGKGLYNPNNNGELSPTEDLNEIGSQMATSDPRILAMPGADQYANMSDEDKGRWLASTGFGLAGSLAAPALALGLGASSIPIIGTAGGAALAGLLSGGALLGSGAMASTINEDLKSENEKKRAAAEDNASLKGHLTEDDENKNYMSQEEQFYNWIENTDSGRQFAEDYLNNYGLDFTRDNYGYSNLRGSQNMDAWSDAVGLSGNYGGGVSDLNGNNLWMPLYSGSGVDLSMLGEDPETARQNLYDYLYVTHVLNPDEMFYDGFDWKRAGYDLDAQDELAKWYMREYNGLLPQQMESLGFDKNDAEAAKRFDANDLAHHLMMSRLYAQDNIESRWLPEINKMRNEAGYLGSLGYDENGILGMVDEDDNRIKRPEHLNAAQAYKAVEPLMPDMRYFQPEQYDGNWILDKRADDTLMSIDKKKKNN